ncbi:hypothetical protein BaRGS_00038108 [Batillaria attramentaria]|uniref:Fe2OG dioxygenase domain-containing protein n=1 Tax=Batillaria attramentaria TaxID=370345 RepID=A0ABD0J6Q3_9CAEN
MAAADDTDNFKAEFKRFKRRDRPLDLSGVIDVSDNSCKLSFQHATVVKPSVSKLPPVLGILPAPQWEIYSFYSHPGFYLIKNPFLSGYQQYWVHRCIVDLPLPPNVTNLRVHPDIDPYSLWSDFVQNRKGGEGCSSVSPLRKLRWTTIGYHYDWDIKEYRENDHTPFPDDIGVLAEYVAASLGFQDFQAEAGIINYYHLDSTLGAHTDHSELDHDAPLLSISFGQDAIFLLGGPTKATKPSAIMLHSGDICVMSGASRLAYHAVPRIMAHHTLGSPSCFALPSYSEMSGSRSELTTQKGGEPRTGVDQDGGVQRHPSVCTGDVSAQNGSDSLTRSGDQEAASLLCVQTQSRHCVMEKQQDVEHPQRTAHSNCQKCQSLSSNEMCITCEKAEGQESDCGKTVAVHAVTLLQNSGDAGSHLASKDCTCDILSSSERESSMQGCAARVREVNEKIDQTLKAIDWEPLSAYLGSSRINVNIRQVLKPGQTFPERNSSFVGSSQSKRLRTDNT